MRDLWLDLTRSAPSGMTPLERTCALLVVSLCMAAGMLITDGKEQWFNAVATTAATAGTGLISTAAAVWRILIGATVLAGLDQADDLLKRPTEALTVSSFGAAIASGALGALLLPYFDAPARLRTWARQQGSWVLWRAVLYYALYAVVAFCMLLTVTALPALFGLGNMRIESDYRAVAIIIAAIAVLSIYAAWGSWRSTLRDAMSSRPDGWRGVFQRSLVRSVVWVGGLIVVLSAFAALMASTKVTEDVFASIALPEFGGFIKEWRTAPVGTALEGLLLAVVLVMLTTPVAMGLEVLSHRLLSPARRSGLVATLKTLAIVLGCFGLGGGLGLFVGATGWGELEAVLIANLVGLVLGLSVGILVVLWRKYMSQRRAMASTGPMVPAAGSGGASLPAGIADAVKRSRQQ